jgi:exosortase
MLSLNINKKDFLYYIPLFLIVIDYTHAYFILPVSLWLAWSERKRFKELIESPSTLGNIVGLLILFFGSALFVLGWRNDYLIILSFSLIPILVGYIYFIFGLKVLRLLWFPLFYLLLMVPPPMGILDAITIPMRYGITAASHYFLSFLGYPIVREGLLLILNDNEIYMGAPCSGFRSLITLISLGLAYTYISSGNIKTKVSLLISIIPMAILGNFLRVILVCLAINYFSNKIGEIVHDVCGYVIFIILILGLICLENLCLKLEKKNEAA